MFKVRMLRSVLALGALLLGLGLSSARAGSSPLAVDKPNGGEVYPSGSSVRVRLLKTKAAEVLIELSTDGGANYTALGKITPKQSLQMSFPIGTVASANCVIKATGMIGKSTVSALSGSFSIAAPLDGNSRSVTSGDLADFCVTNSKLASLSVTSDKISSILGRSAFTGLSEAAPRGNGVADAGTGLVADGSGGVNFTDGPVVTVNPTTGNTSVPGGLAVPGLSKLSRLLVTPDMGANGIDIDSTINGNSTPELNFYALVNGEQGSKSVTLNTDGVLANGFFCPNPVGGSPKKVLDATGPLVLFGAPVASGATPLDKFVIQYNGVTGQWEPNDFVIDTLPLNFTFDTATGSNLTVNNQLTLGTAPNAFALIPDPGTTDMLFKFSTNSLPNTIFHPDGTTDFNFRVQMPEVAAVIGNFSAVSVTATATVVGDGLFQHDLNVMGKESAALASIGQLTVTGDASHAGTTTLNNLQVNGTANISSLSGPLAVTGTFTATNVNATGIVTGNSGTFNTLTVSTLNPAGGPLAVSGTVTFIDLTSGAVTTSDITASGTTTVSGAFNAGSATSFALPNVNITGGSGTNNNLNAGTVGGFPAISFLRSNADSALTTGTLTLDPGTTLAVNGSFALPTAANSISGGGPGSGLNSDTLDGFHALSFLRADANSAVTTGHTLTMNSGATLSVAGTASFGGLTNLNGTTTISNANANFISANTAGITNANITSTATIATANITTANIGTATITGALHTGTGSNHFAGSMTVLTSDVVFSVPNTLVQPTSIIFLQLTGNTDATLRVTSVGNGSFAFSSSVPLSPGDGVNYVIVNVP